MTRVVLAPYRVASQPRAAGHLWVYLQYVDALLRAGCEVWWLEELTRKADPAKDGVHAAQLRERLRPFGLADRVILYRWPTGTSPEVSDPAYVTMPAQQAEAMLGAADLLLNFHYALPGSMLARFRRTALIDIDPGLLQLWWANDQLRVQPHDVYFSIGEHLPPVPHETTATWVHTPPVVSVDLWPYRFDPRCASYTSVSSWHSSTYVLMDGSLLDTNKRLTYLDYLDLPRRSGRSLELATVLSESEAGDRALLEANGWALRDALAVAADPGSYQAYVQSSRGELGLAKPLYVLLENAWVSDRTACYLASGKPAVVQHTGSSSYLPDGLGLLRFSTVDEAADALAEVDADYERHCRAAREIAETYFSALPVVTRMLDHALGRGSRLRPGA